MLVNLLSIHAQCRNRIFLFAFASALVGVETAPTAEPLARAHAHNDYEHDRPLLDALEHGFCSVEADVFATNGDLLVAHTPIDLRADRNLRKLYLEPLRDRIHKNDGVFKNGPRFTLLIDFKTPAEPTYQRLRETLVDFPELWTPRGKQDSPPVSIIISGNRPFESLSKAKPRFCGLDGRLSNLSSDLAADVLPLISDRWGTHFTWRGEGPFPVAEREKLRDVVEKAHAAGRRVRFWATPENEVVWRELVDAGVDHINTDQLGRLQKFLLAERSR